MNYIIFPLDIGGLRRMGTECEAASLCMVQCSRAQTGIFKVSLSLLVFREDELCHVFAELLKTYCTGT